MKSIDIKSLTGVLGLLIFLLVIFITSCEDDSKPSSQTRIEQNLLVKEVEPSYSTIARPNEVRITGEHMMSWRSDSRQGTLYFYAETQSHKHFFIITDMEAKMLRDTKINDIELLTAGVVLKSTNESILLYTNNETGIALNDDLQNREMSLEGIKAGSIAHYSFSKDVEEIASLVNFDILKRQKDAWDYIVSLGGHAKRGNCQSGGTGATSCSLASGGGLSCSVSCASDYWACCNTQQTLGGKGMGIPTPICNCVPSGDGSNNQN